MAPSAASSRSGSAAKRWAKRADGEVAMALVLQVFQPRALARAQALARPLDADQEARVVFEAYDWFALGQTIPAFHNAFHKEEYTRKPSPVKCPSCQGQADLPPSQHARARIWRITAPSPRGRERPRSWQRLVNGASGSWLPASVVRRAAALAPPIAGRKGARILNLRVAAPRPLPDPTLCHTPLQLQFPATIFFTICLFLGISATIQPTLDRATNATRKQTGGQAAPAHSHLPALVPRHLPPRQQFRPTGVEQKNHSHAHH